MFLANARTLSVSYGGPVYGDGTADEFGFGRPSATVDLPLIHV